MAKEEQEAKMEAAAPVETAVDTDEAEKTEKVRGSLRCVILKYKLLFSI